MLSRPFFLARRASRKCAEKLGFARALAYARQYDFARLSGFLVPGLVRLTSPTRAFLFQE
jgi:hypothetical protein